MSVILGAGIYMSRDNVMSASGIRLQNPERGQAHLLITNDQPETMRAVDLELGGEFTYEFASGIESARRMVATGNFQLALCDIEVAGEPGLEMVEQVMLRHPEIAVVIAAGEDDPEVVKQAADFVTHGYLVKPLRSGQLYLTVISALRRRELEIAEQAHSDSLEQRFQTVIDMAPMPIFAKDSSHRFVVANAKAEELTGLGRGRLVGETDAAILRPGAVEFYSGVDDQIFSEGSSYAAEAAILVEGVERNYKIVKFPLRDGNGDVAAVGGISVDITDEKAAIRLRDELFESQQKAILELSESRRETVELLTRAIESHDLSTGEHVSRMAMVASMLGTHLGLDPERVDLLLAAAPMHDVGKIGISDEILHKNGPLSEAERRDMERHTEIGYEILANSKSRLLRMAATIALTHHERYNGSGYPHGTAGTSIPLEGRITAVADVFDALLTDRCYRPAFTVEAAVSLIKEGRGSQFDPSIVDVLLENMEEALALRN